MMSAGAGGLDPLVGAHDRVGQRLHGVRVLVDEALRRVQAAAGIGPPNTFSASATMRVSETIFRSPERCSSVITGSRLLIASIWPERIAATAPLPAPTPMMRHVARLQAGLGEHEVGHHVGRRARRRDADLLALQVGHGLEVRHRLRVDAQHDLRRAALQHEGAQLLALGLHVEGVLEGARDHVGTAADHRVQRLRAAGEVDDGHVQPLGLEVAQRLGDGQRQVVQQVLAAHGDRELGLLERLRAHAGRAGPAAWKWRRAGCGVAWRGRRSGGGLRFWRGPTLAAPGVNAQRSVPVEWFSMTPARLRGCSRLARVGMAACALAARLRGPRPDRAAVRGIRRRLGRCRPRQRHHAVACRHARSTNRRARSWCRSARVLKGRASQTSVGSGFFVTRDGHIVTNFHVVSQAALKPERHDLVYVTADGREAPLTILQIDVLHDLALLQGRRRAGTPLRRAGVAPGGPRARAGRAHLLAGQPAGRRLRGDGGQLQRPGAAQLLPADLLRRRAVAPA